jgi:hypothetical protein
MSDRHSTTSIHAMSCERPPHAEFFRPDEHHGAFVSVNIADVRTDLTMWDMGLVTLRAMATEHNRGTLFLDPDHARHLAESILAVLEEAKAPEVAA